MEPLFDPNEQSFTELFERLLHHEVEHRGPMRAVDIGAGLWDFVEQVKPILQRLNLDIQEFFSTEIDFSRIEFIARMERFFKIKRDVRLLNDTELLKNYGEASFDIIMLFAPSPKFKGEIIDNIVRLLKSRGLLFVQFWEKETAEFKRFVLQRLSRELAFFEFSYGYMDLSESGYPKEPKLYIFKHRNYPFSSFVQQYGKQGRVYQASSAVTSRIYANTKVNFNISPVRTNLIETHIPNIYGFTGFSIGKGIK